MQSCFVGNSETLCPRPAAGYHDPCPTRFYAQSLAHAGDLPLRGSRLLAADPGGALGYVVEYEPDPPAAAPTINLEIEPVEAPGTVHWVDPIHRG